MSRFKGLRFSSLIVVLFFALPALAQFEVSPDHFDPADKKAPMITHKAGVNRLSTFLGGGDHRKNSKPRTNANAYRKEKPKRQVATSTWPRPVD